MPEEKVCEKCNGAGQFQSDDYTYRQCMCSYVRMVKAALGTEIASAKTIHASPLYVPNSEPGGAPQTDLTGKNLRIRGLWSDVLAHLKWAFICKLGDTNLAFRHRVVTDERLRTVWVGSESYMARSRKRRDEMETYNSLSDYIGPFYDLVIIRLGHLGYKNIAMPGILKESLMMRQTILKPVWVVEELDKPYCEGHFAWNEDTADYVERHYEALDITPTRAIERRDPGEIQRDAGGDTSLEDEQPPEDTAPDSQQDADDPMVDDVGEPLPAVTSIQSFVIPGEDDGGGGYRSKKKSSYGKNKQRNGGGGGPLG